MATARGQRLWDKYRITEIEYDRLFMSQAEVCAICQERETSTGRWGELRSLAVDHCHTTGDIRGLLCSRCNIGLGYFLDDTIRLEAAVAYLRRDWPIKGRLRAKRARQRQRIKGQGMVEG